jgi:hypothetical protein
VLYFGLEITHNNGHGRCSITGAYAVSAAWLLLAITRHRSRRNGKVNEGGGSIGLPKLSSVAGSIGNYIQPVSINDELRAWFEFGLSNL